MNVPLLPGAAWMMQISRRQSAVAGPVDRSVFAFARRGVPSTARISHRGLGAIGPLLHRNKRVQLQPLYQAVSHAPEAFEAPRPSRAVGSVALAVCNWVTSRGGVKSMLMGCALVTA